jgi:hypothetical protein
MKDQLIKMLDDAEKYVRTIRIGSEQDLISLFDLRDDDNNSHILITPFSGDTQEEVDQSKDVAAFLIRQYMVKHNITHYLFLTEAWAITRTKDKYIPGISKRPSECDDRVEMILANANDGINNITSSWRIKRNGSICTDLIPIDIKKENTVDGSGGRFDNLLEGI